MQIEIVQGNILATRAFEGNLIISLYESTNKL